MNLDEILKKIKACKSMPELDSLRKQCVVVGTESHSQITIQIEFIKKMHKLQRIPLAERN